MSPLRSRVLLLRGGTLRCVWTLPGRSPADQIIKTARCLPSSLWNVGVPLPGFYCLEGSEAAAPTQTASGDVCPAGHYCAEGSSVPTPCPAGFHRNETGGKGEGDCYRCPSGKKNDLMAAWLRAPKSFILFKKSTLTLFEMSCQAGSRSPAVRRCVSPVRLASTASPTAPTPCSAQLVTSVLTRVQTAVLSPVLKAPTALARVSPLQVTAHIPSPQTHNPVSFRSTDGTAVACSADRRRVLLGLLQ